MKIRIGTKLSALAISLVVLTGAIVGGMLYGGIKAVLVGQEYDMLSQQVRLRGKNLIAGLGPLREDLQILAGTPAIEGIVRARDAGGIDPLDGSSEDQWRDRLADIFAEYLRTKAAYLQIRYIGVEDGGREIVRVDRLEDTVVKVEDEALQRKGHRPYFQEAIRLASSEIYLSSVELNREQGQIEEPHRQVVRAATVIKNSNQEPIGILIINMDFGTSLRDLLATTPQPYRAYVTNAAGDFLAHPNPAMTYGFDLGERHRIQDVYPELGVMFEPGNLDTVNRVPLERSEGRLAIQFLKVPFDPDQPDRFLGVALAISYDDFMVGPIAMRNRAAMTTVVLTAMAALLAFLFSRVLVRPLDQITRAAEALATESPNVPLPLSARDEIGILARSFQTMIERVIERNREVRLRDRAIQSASNGIIITDATQSDNPIVYVNPAFERITGYGAAEVIGRNPRILKSDRHSVEFYEELWETITAGNDWHGEFCNKKKNGELYWELASISPILDDDGDITHFVAVEEDITERKQLEEQLRFLSSRLSLTEEHERRRLAADLHDRIGQTLAVCKMKLGAARAATDSEDPDQLLEELAELLQQTIRETRSLTFELCPPILYELGLEAALEWLGEQIQTRHGLSVQYEDDGQPKPLADDVRSTLFRAVSELLNNIVKHADTQTASLSIRKVENQVQIAVEDEGQGFDTFDNGSSETGDGGFGLFSIRQRLEVLGGRVSIDTQLDCGTRVVLTAPLLVDEGEKHTR